jgi:hypothetical protein
LWRFRALPSLSPLEHVQTLEELVDLLVTVQHYLLAKMRTKLRQA